MTYLTLKIEANTPEAYSIEALAVAEHIAPEAAALKLLNSSPLARKSKATPSARSILGAFSSPEESKLMDEVLKIIHSDNGQHAPSWLYPEHRIPIAIDKLA